MSDPTRPEPADPTRYPPTRAERGPTQTSDSLDPAPPAHARPRLDHLGPGPEQHHAPATRAPALGRDPGTPAGPDGARRGHSRRPAVPGRSRGGPQPATSSRRGTRRPPVTYLPAPTGPNWGLVVVGLVFGLVGAGVVANQVTGFQVASLTELGPSVLVIAGLACALLGLVGIVTRRRRG